jgi:hypothetical protein|nr:MAG TPA: hypothetical protein [Caudoviricetes sp.]
MKQLVVGGHWNVQMAAESGRDGTFLKQIFIQSDKEPSTPSGSASIPIGWSENANFPSLEKISYSGQFYSSGGVRISPKNPGPTGFYKDRVSFKTTENNQVVRIIMRISTEANCDFGIVGKVDETLIDGGTYYDRYSGTLSGVADQVVATSGTHFIDVAYKKDASVNANEDNIKYYIAYEKQIWVSSAMATYNKTAARWEYGSWSRPARYIADSGDKEYIFRRSTGKTMFTPESDPVADDFIPQPFEITEDYRGSFVASQSQVAGAIYISGDRYYKCIKARPANSSVLITNTAYFVFLQPWTDDPLGTTKELPYELMSMRAKKNGKWSGFSVPVVHMNYAQNGQDGLPGPAGRRGRLPYPAGVWSSTVGYSATDDKTPIVYYEPGETYYVMNDSISVVGLNPATDYAQHGENATWIPFENYKTIFTEILMTNFAKLASAIFYGDYMFSQQGTDSAGNSTTAYQGFGTSDFTPNLQINFKTGEIIGNNCFFKGSVKSELIVHTANNLSCVSKKNNNYVIKSDNAQNLVSLSVGTGRESYGTEFTIVNGGSGIVKIFFIADRAKIFLYKGKGYNYIQLNKPGDSVGLMYVPVTVNVSENGAAYVIKNRSDFSPATDGVTLNSI